ncbi:hypothetical protein BGZ61DRAFT_54885 [Ilyonectria robusta]|uniref:uncharacterized protein n=1 Tax=Ilyonectria robusta TaxID=1079257 RepID=UPI001E8ECD82|nr:uncharacterized protein BGZ61DRAFT_54885 [Ilyonectria robusta]KAH8684964.1 hypothetical protein BGZ61DRAFT_54885 [Ilyonectria robusta]
MRTKMRSPSCKQIASGNNHSVESLLRLFSHKAPRDPIEEVDNHCLVREFAAREGVLRPIWRPSTKMPTTTRSTTTPGNIGREEVDRTNMLSDLQATGCSRPSVGNWHSESALASGSCEIRGAYKELNRARIKDDSRFMDENKSGGLGLFA